MSYRYRSDCLIAAFSNTINGLSIGNTSLGTTDPHMTFMPQLIITETAALTGTATAPPTVSSGITGPNFNDIGPNSSNANLQSLHGIGRQSLAGTGVFTIAPGSQIFCRVSVAGTGASVLTVRYIVIGTYF